MQSDTEFEDEQLELRYRLLDEIDHLERLIDWVMFRRRLAEAKQKDNVVEIGRGK
jgi:hypothetical protein